MVDVDAYLPARHLMPRRVQLKSYQLGEGMGSTLNEKYNVGSPRTSRNAYNNLIVVPNGDSGGIYEVRRAATEGNTHSKHDQQRRGSEG